MTTLKLETEPRAIAASVNQEKLLVDLADGRSLKVPLH